MIVEIRTYRLKPNSGQAFLRVFREQARPLLEKHGLRVVDCDLSLHDENEAYLIRAFDSLEQREAQETAFYSSDDWINGPREAVLSLIEAYHTVVLDADRLPAPSHG